MDRVIDNGVLLALGLGLTVFAFEGVPSFLLVASFLFAVAVAGILEVARGRAVRLAAEAALFAAALAEPTVCAYAAIGVYGACAQGLFWLAGLWALPLVVCWAHGNVAAAAGAFIVAALAAAMALRTRGHLAEERRLRALRDSLQEKHLALTAQTRDMQERQDLEVRCAVLDERARIAREIHDNVGHLLTRAVLQTEALAVVHEDDAPLTHDLTAVRDTLACALDTVRASVHNLHDDAFDLRTTLENIIGEFPALEGELHFEAAQVKRPQALAVVALVREGITNAAAHGGATRATVSFVEYPAFYQLTIEDNGCGPSAEHAVGHSRPFAAQGRTSGGEHSLPAPDVSSGLGLVSMRERVEALGGSFAFRSAAAPGAGSRLFATFPKTVEENL